MGCDIHMFTEFKRTYKPPEEQEWQCADYFEYDEERDEEVDGLNPVPIYSDRSYGLFAGLAGVRKGWGTLTQFDEPRGLPQDVSDVVRKWSDYWGADGHSHSYMTYGELRDWYWHKVWDSKSVKELFDAVELRIRKKFWVRRQEEIPEKYHNLFRIVFWFDN